MKVYSWNIGKISTKTNIQEHIVPIFLVNSFQNIGKTNKIQRIFQQQFLKNGMLNLAQIWELSLVCFSLCNRPILISTGATLYSVIPL